MPDRLYVRAVMFGSPFTSGKLLLRKRCPKLAHLAPLRCVSCNTSVHIVALRSLPMLQRSKGVFYQGMMDKRSSALVRGLGSSFTGRS